MTPDERYSDDLFDDDLRPKEEIWVDEAEYVGPHEELRGKRALVRPDGTYELPLEQRTLEAQFHQTHLAHPTKHRSLGVGWHTFPAAHFKILVPVRI